MGSYHQGIIERDQKVGVGPLGKVPYMGLLLHLLLTSLPTMKWTAFLSYNGVLRLLSQAWAWVEPSAPVSLNKSSLPNCLCQGFGNRPSNQMQDLMYSLVPLHCIFVYSNIQILEVFSLRGLKHFHSVHWNLKSEMIDKLSCGVFPKYIFQNFILNTLNVVDLSVNYNLIKQKILKSPQQQRARDFWLLCDHW